MDICFNCGSEKPRALETCPSCHKTPQSSREYLLSVALSTYLSSGLQLRQYQEQIRSGASLAVPHETMLLAQKALGDPQAMAMLGASLPAAADPSPAVGPPVAAAPPMATPQEAQPSGPAQAGARQQAGSPQPAEDRSAKAPADMQPARAGTGPASGPAGAGVSVLAPAGLLDSPFALLDVTIEDTAERIRASVATHSPQLGTEICQAAGTALSIAGHRLAFELGWLPGLEPARARRLLQTLVVDPVAARAETHVPTLAHANLLSALIEQPENGRRRRDLVGLVRQLATLDQGLDPTQIMRQINAARAVSGFPELRSIEPIVTELAQRRRYFRSVAGDALDTLPSHALVQAMTELVDSATDGGKAAAPQLVASLVDRYEDSAQGFLRTEAGNVRQLVDAAGANPADPGRALDALQAVLKNWDMITRPIQLAARARGGVHEASAELASTIRRLGVEFLRDRDMPTQALRIMRILRKSFALLPEVAERAERDAAALEEEVARRQGRRAQPAAPR